MSENRKYMCQKIENIIEFQDWGKMDYKQAWEKQTKLFDKLILQKVNKQPTENYLIFVEHPHVYTLGKSGNNQNLLITAEILQKIEAAYYHVNRGGDITYHGPGQIVGYPIFDLDNLLLSYKEYINKLEISIIKYLKQRHFIESFQLEGATGVWIETERGAEKICAIGTRASRHITMHGFALNINTDLRYFEYINPCGFADKGVASVEKIKQKKQNFEQEKLVLQQFIVEEFKN